MSRHHRGIQSTETTVPGEWQFCQWRVRGLSRWFSSRATALLEYALRVGDVVPEDLYHFVKSLGPTAEEAYVTTAQQLIEKGKAEGKAEGRAEILLRQLGLRFGPLPPEVMDRVRAASLDELDLWAERILTAGSLAEAMH